MIKPLLDFKKQTNIYWCPLVMKTSNELDECCNPRCNNQARILSSHLINGEIFVVDVCLECATKIVRACGEQWKHLKEKKH